MKTKRYRYLLLGLLVLLSSCDFLGIGGDDGVTPPDKTLSLAWQRKLPSNPGSASPAIENDNIFLLGFGLSRLNLQTGDVIWQSSLDSSPPFTISTESGNLLLADESVIVNQNTTVQSFAKADGRRLWATSVGTENDSEVPTAAATIRPLAQTSSRVFIGSTDKVTALNKSSGAVALNIALETLAPQGATQLVTSLAASNGNTPLVFAATQFNVDEIGFRQKGNLVAINAETGETVWATGITKIVSDSTTSAEFLASDLAITNNLLIVLTTTEVVAVEPNTGDIMWQTSLNDEAAIPGQSHILVEGNAVFLNTVKGTALRLNADDGTIVWQTKIGNDVSVGISGGLALDGGQLYNPIFGFEGAGIRVLDAADGTIEQNITGVDVDGVNFDFDFLGGIAVSNQILVRQGAINTYGVEL